MVFIILSTVMVNITPKVLPELFSGTEMAILSVGQN